MPVPGGGGPWEFSGVVISYRDYDPNCTPRDTVDLVSIVLRRSSETGNLLSHFMSIRS